MGRKYVVFVVLGRLGNNLSISKLAPICNLDSVSGVFAFRESKSFDYNQKLTYVTLPETITKLKPRFLSRAIRWIYEPIQLLWFALKLRPDFINGVYTLPKGFNSFLVSRLTGIKCIISVIGGKEEIESDFRILKHWRAINIFMLKHCYAVTCKGGKDLEYLTGIGIEREKIFVFNGGIDIIRFNPGNSPRVYDIIFAGRLNHNKGSFRVLELVRILSADMPGIKCAILGDGEQRKSFEERVKKEGLQENIICFGHVLDPENYFRQTKVFVLPSTNEGLSTAMLEAMSCGCVPVVSDVGNTSEAVKDGVNGFLIEHFDDIMSFVSRIELLLKDKISCSDLSDQAIKTVRESYSYEVQSGFFGAIFKQQNEEL